MHRHLLVLCAVVSALTSCASYRNGFGERLDVAEQVFRALSQGMEPGEPLIYCLEGRSPDAAFMARFDDLAPRVHPCAETVLWGEDKEVRLRGFDKRAVQLRVSNIRFVSPTEATANGTVYHASLSAGSSIFELELREGAWVVTKRAAEWIS